jgi:alkylhydroperoxidase family enzyme
LAVAGEDRYAAAIDRLREAAHPDRPAPAELVPYLDKVRTHAYRVTDEDVERLLALGVKQDEHLEQTVSTAAAAGLDRLEAALKALR